MAIELITGLPGNAKTLHALGRVIERSVRENRAVYYAGLKGFKADDPRLKGIEWKEIDPLRWMDCPSGSLILIDECQTVFRNRSLGSLPPPHVTELEQHRHRGIDFVMLTQHPSLIDPAIRKLTQTHLHMVRIWGMEASTVHKWDGVRDDCHKPHGRRDSDKAKWAFDKRLYGLYHSADVHTMKRQIPMRAKLLLLVPLALAAAGYYVYSYVQRMTDKAPAAVESRQPINANPLVSVPPGRTGDKLGAFDPVADAKQYMAANTPRIEGLPHTAPKYDELTKPVRVPVPAMCIQSGGLEKPHCKCYTQQGTPMDVNLQMCIGFARNGYFMDFDPERDRQDTSRSQQSVAVMSRVPDHPLPSSHAPRVMAMADLPSPSRLTGPPPMRADRASDRYERSAETYYQ